MQGEFCNEYVLDFTHLIFNSCRQEANCTPWDIPLPNADNGWLPYCTSFFDGEEHFNSLGEFMKEMANYKPFMSKIETLLWSIKTVNVKNGDIVK